MGKIADMSVGSVVHGGRLRQLATERHLSFAEPLDGEDSFS